MRIRPLTVRCSCYYSQHQKGSPLHLYEFLLVVSSFYDDITRNVRAPSLCEGLILFFPDLRHIAFTHCTATIKHLADPVFLCSRILQWARPADHHILAQLKSMHCTNDNDASLPTPSPYSANPRSLPFATCEFRIYTMMHSSYTWSKPHDDLQIYHLSSDNNSIDPNALSHELQVRY